MTAAVHIFILTVLASLLKGAVNQDLPVSADCLACICESISRCSTSITWGDKKSIGPFAITEAYWNNAGKPTIKGMSPEDPEAFPTCTKNLYCSGLTVEEYMKKFKRDCNRNGEFDCEDFALIHAYGRDGCLGTTLPTNIGQRYRQCVKFVFTTSNSYSPPYSPQVSSGLKY